MVDGKIIIIKKAWSIDNSNLEDPWFHDDYEKYYGTIGQAKRLALLDNDACKTVDGENISFLNIRVKRDKDFDIVMYEGQKVKRYEINQLKRDIKIKNLPKDKTYYVQDKRNYVGNSVLWWGKNSNGYVCNLPDAHEYTYEEIQKFIGCRDTDVIWPSDHVKKAIRQHVDVQYLHTENSI